MRLLRLAVDTHLITAHHALPLMIAKPGGLLVEVTDGTAEYNADHYRLSVFYDLAKTAAIRMAWAHAKDLAPHGATAVAITPGWMRSEMMLDNYGVTEASWRDATAVSPHFVISEIAAFCRTRRRRARRRPGAGPLERTIALKRRAGEGLWLHRPRRIAAGLLALHPGGPGGRQTRGRDRVPLSESDPIQARSRAALRAPA